MLARLETMILMGTDMPLRAVRKQIASSIDVIIQLGRLRDHSRRVLEITEILDCDRDEYRLNPLFIFEESDYMLCEPPAVYEGQPVSRVHGHLTRTGNHLVNRRKLGAASLEQVAI